MKKVFLALLICVCVMLMLVSCGGNEHNHTFGEWAVTAPAGCETAGIKIHSCTTCEYSELGQIKPTGHSFNDGECQVCNKGINELNCEHSFSEWKIQRIATCVSYGIKARSCNLCSVEDKQIEPQKGHSFSTETGECTRVGCDAKRSWIITLDPNGGELPEGSEDEFEVADKERIGKLPTPTRLGYKFLGWYDIEDTSMREEITRKFEVDDDYDLIAQWEPAGTVINIEFNPTSGELDKTVLDGKTYLQMLAGTMIGDVIDELPEVTREGYEFRGWKIGSTTGEDVAMTTTFTTDVTLYVDWYELPICLDGTYIHDWGVWKPATEATCTAPGQRVQACSVCGQNKYMDDEGRPALEHTYSNGGAYSITVIDNNIKSVRTCRVCGEDDLHNYKQITYASCDTPVVEGNWFTGEFTNSAFIDGDLTPSMATKGDGAVKVTLNVKNGDSVYVDAICVAGKGVANFELNITYADGTSEFLGNGTFGSDHEQYGNINLYTVGKEIRALEFLIIYPSVGTDFLGEIAFLVAESE